MVVEDDAVLIVRRLWGRWRVCGRWGLVAHAVEGRAWSGCPGTQGSQRRCVVAAWPEWMGLG